MISERIIQTGNLENRVSEVRMKSLIQEINDEADKNRNWITDSIRGKKGKKQINDVSVE